jgi:hypothetical protein
MELGSVKRELTKVKKQVGSLQEQNQRLRSQLAVATGSTAALPTPTTAPVPAAGGEPKSDGRDAAATAAAEAAALAKLPAALRNFFPIEEVPAVAAYAEGDGGGRRVALEKAVLADPTSTAAKVALREHLAGLKAATQKAVGARLGQENLFRSCFEAITAGADAFRDVYSAVWKVVELSEPVKIGLYEQQVTALRTSLASAAAVAGGGGTAAGKRKQRLPSPGGVAELYQAAAVIKPKHDAVVSDLAGRLGMERGGGGDLAFHLPDSLKKTTRIIEKTSLVCSVDAISDVVRSMLVVPTMAGVITVLDMFQQLEQEGVLKIVRIKDRFVEEPSSGGCSARF